MNVNITDSDIELAVQNAVKNEVKGRVQKVADANMTLFSEQNIRSLVYECVSDRIEDKLVKETLKQIDYSHLLLLVTNACVHAVTEHIKDMF